MLQLIPYFGGKGTLFNWMSQYFPEHDFFIDAFGGSGVVILNDYAPGLYNEVDPDLFWMMINIKHSVESFINRLDGVEYSESTCKQASRYYKLPEGSFDRSVAYYTWQRQRYGGGEAASRGFKWHGKGTWDNMLLRLPLISQRLKQITITNKSALNLLPELLINGMLKNYSNPLIYLDPPYPRELRTRGLYKYEFTEHKKLIQTLELLPFNFVMSSYDATLGFPFVKKSTKNQNKQSREEYLYVVTKGN